MGSGVWREDPLICDTGAAAELPKIIGVVKAYSSCVGRGPLHLRVVR